MKGAGKRNDIFPYKNTDLRHFPLKNEDPMCLTQSMKEAGKRNDIF